MVVIDFSPVVELAFGLELGVQFARCSRTSSRSWVATTPSGSSGSSSTRAGDTLVVIITGNDVRRDAM